MKNFVEKDWYEGLRAFKGMFEEFSFGWDKDGGGRRGYLSHSAADASFGIEYWLEDGFRAMVHLGSETRSDNVASFSNETLAGLRQECEAYILSVCPSFVPSDVDPFAGCVATANVPCTIEINMDEIEQIFTTPEINLAEFFKGKVRLGNTKLDPEFFSANHGKPTFMDLSEDGVLEYSFKK